MITSSWTDNRRGSERSPWHSPLGRGSGLKGSCSHLSESGKGFRRQGSGGLACVPKELLTQRPAHPHPCSLQCISCWLLHFILPVLKIL